jgi:hypothetical protein
MSPQSSHSGDAALPPGTVLGTGDPIPFTFKTLWGPAVLHPLNHKSTTLSVLNLRSPQARNFHLYAILHRRGLLLNLRF